MAMKRVAILALAGAALAQMDTNSGGTPDFLTPAAYSTYAEPSVAVVDSYPTLTTVAASSVPTSSSAHSSYDSITPEDNSSSESITVVVGPSVTANPPVVTATNVVGVSSQPKTNSTLSISMGGMGGGGWSAPKPSVSATATGKPLPNDGVVNEISIGLFLVSVALTALLQI